jgi:nucleoside-diphosphate-sugar epimerase
MKVLFIGGTGNISSAVSRLAVSQGIDLYHLNRGLSKLYIPGVKTINGDISNPVSVFDELSRHHWDVVVNWVAYNEADITRDIQLFNGRTKQYVFISSASVYQKPLTHPVITESVPLCNPFWEYSRNKIACEDRLMMAYRQEGFPMTIVRPSLTYNTVIPIAIGGFDEYTTADRIIKGKKIIVHGDGKSLWTVTSADDFANGLIGLLGNIHAIGHAFHITSDEILTWDQIYSILADALGKQANIVHIPSDLICKLENSYTGNLLGDKAESVIFDNSKIKMFVPRFKAVIPFSEGIKKTLAWFDANPAKKFINPKTNEIIDRVINVYETIFPE